MRGVVFDLKPARWLLARAAGSQIPALYDGPLSCLTLTQMESRTLLTSRWVRVRPLLAGVCGSDLSTITTHTSPILSAFTAFPIVMGHELVGIIEEVGKDVSRVKVGDRVVVNPFFGCEVRGITPLCAPCQKGQTALCQNAAEGSIAPGMLMGFCPDEPGGWSDEALCHESQCHVVPENLSDEQAVLVEPLAVGLHATLLRVPRPNETALVIGGGMIAFAVLAALQWSGTHAKIVHSFWENFQEPLSRQFGAGSCAVREDEAELIRRVGGRSYRPRFGPEVFAGGYDVIYDCVGTAQSVNTALKLAMPRGTIVLVGAAAKLPDVDWAFIWSREICLVGSMAYGPEPALGGSPLVHTIDAVMRFMEHSPLPFTDLITHRLPLDRYRQAIRANLRRAQSGAIKTVFDLR